MLIVSAPGSQPRAHSQRIPCCCQCSKSISPGLSKKRNNNRPHRLYSDSDQQRRSHRYRNPESCNSLKKAFENPSHRQDQQELIREQLSHAVPNDKKCMGLISHLIQQYCCPYNNQNRQCIPDSLASFRNNHFQICLVKYNACKHGNGKPDRSRIGRAPLKPDHQYQKYNDRQTCQNPHKKIYRYIHAFSPKLSYASAQSFY